ncbi:hypothetical protein GUJ93_ZPchr0006g43709 [Zizania palustris]|uniref:Uncharacterized protein n=1 Tax=Zizania palustris TaxID=103762 RepID=A0A8J5SGW1_ZIZPA|nr:hypothetical protein GUJ93_ZPchr0006g43709 [Zizania palustris]
MEIARHTGGGKDQGKGDWAGRGQGVSGHHWAARGLQGWRQDNDGQGHESEGGGNRTGRVRVCVQGWKRGGTSTMSEGEGKGDRTPGGCLEMWVFRSSDGYK